MRSLLILIVLSTATVINCITIRVSHNGLLDATAIQQAIDMSVSEDTILVYPGRYVENINYIGKNIVITSLVTATGNIAYRDSTIIDGNQNGPCVFLYNGEYNTSIIGFTITNGNGFLHSSQNRELKYSL